HDHPAADAAGSPGVGQTSKELTMPLARGMIPLLFLLLPTERPQAGRPAEPPPFAGEWHLKQGYQEGKDLGPKWVEERKEAMLFTPTKSITWRADDCFGGDFALRGRLGNAYQIDLDDSTPVAGFGRGLRSSLLQVTGDTMVIATALRDGRPTTLEPGRE